MYPTFINLCILPKVESLEGTSIATALHSPKTATDRDVFLPYMSPGAYAIINQNWRYIRYKDTTEELYNVRKDPNEWTNLANDEEFAAIKKQLQASAPKTFAPDGTQIQQRKLVKEGETFHWEAKGKKKQP
jgi:arylsulfatase A-like enzyme